MNRGEGEEAPANSDDKSSMSEGDRERIQEIVAGYIDRLVDGDTIDFGEILAKHPGVGEQVLQDLETFVELRPEAARREGLGTIGDFTLRRKIGQGGMGVVYEAWQKSMQRKVALKVLPAGMAGDTNAVTRFVREAQLAGKLNHPNVVPVFAMGIDGGTPYYAMEFVEGETLAEILEDLKAKERGEVERELRTIATRISPLLPEGRPGEAVPGSGGGIGGGDPHVGAGRISSWSWACGALFQSGESQLTSPVGGEPGEARQGSGAIRNAGMDLLYYFKIALAFSDVADGLQHAHSKGVIHRDLKPSNLILDRQGRLRILDFGLARQEGLVSLTQSGDFLGTPSYMSPEQAMAKRLPVDHRTDVYSLGATLYEMLCLRPPFEGASHADTISRIISRDPRPPRQLNAGVPRDLQTIALKCLRKAPGDRYTTAEALAQDLRRFGRGDPIEARPQAALERLARRAWRNKARTAAVCLLGLLLLTSGLLLHQRWRQAHAERLAAYRDMILSAIGQMELGRPSRRTETTGAALARRSAPGSRLRGRDETGLFAGALALEPESADAVPDPVEQARDKLRVAAELMPGSPDAHFHLSRAESLLGREEAAQAALHQALHCRPDFLPAWIARESAARRSAGETATRIETALGAAGQAEVVKVHLAAYRAESEGDWKATEAALGKLLALHPGARESPEPYVGFRMRTLLKRGRVRLQVGDLDGALEDFVMVRGLWPDLAEPVLLLGKAYHLKGNGARAEERLAEFHTEAPRKDEFALEAAGLYRDLGEPEKGLAWVLKASQSSAREVWRSYFARHLGRMDESLQAAQGALAIDPLNADAHRNLGIVFRIQGRLEDALPEARRACELAPVSLRAHEELVYVLTNLGKVDEAIEVARTLTRVDPGNARAWVILGEAFRNRGKRDDVIAAYREAIALDPTNAMVHNSLGIVFRQQNKPDEAVAEFREAIRLDPKEPRLRDNLGNALTAQGQLDAAVAAFRGAIDLDPKDARAHAGLGYALLRQNKLDEAITAFREAIRLEPASAFPHRNLGVALDVQRKTAEAITEYLETIRLDPTDARTHANLAARFRELGRYDEAITHCRKAVELDPKFGGAHQELGRMLRDKGELVEACSELRRALELGERSFLFPEIRALLRRRERSDLDGEVALLVDSLERVSTSEPEVNPEALASLALARLWPSSRRDPRRALECAQGYVRTAGEREPDVLAFLADIQLAGGDARAAVRTLERPEVLPGVARLLRAMGEPTVAEAWLRDALREDRPESPAVWELWFAISAADLKRGAKEILTDLEAPTGFASPEESYAADLRWILRTLLAEGTVRIDCGGPGGVGATGVVWRRDCFFLGGATRRGDDLAIDRAEDEAPYRSERVFPASEGGPQGYRVPLPPGRYEITLGFVERDEAMPEIRKFDVLLEGRPVLEEYSPKARTVEEPSCNQAVEDGHLDIEFVRRHGDPTVSTIVLRRREKLAEEHP